MGKIHCEACKKSCKGKAVRLQDKYFHIKCFNCKHCKKQLAAGGFYAKDSDYYCTEDYQKLFGTKCAACNKFVEGEVITALGNTYHQNCFSCTKCGKKFAAGDKVTFSSKDYLCNQCLEEADGNMKKWIDNKFKKSPKKKGAKSPDEGQKNANGEGPTKATSPTGKPVSAATSQVQSGPITSTPAKAEINHLSSPTSDVSDFSSDSRVQIITDEVGQGDAEKANGPLSPLSCISDDSVFSPRRLDAEFSDDESFLRPPTREAQENGLETAGPDCKLTDSLRKIYNSVSNAFCPPGLQAGGQKGRLSPIQQILQYRTPSPVGSAISRSSRKSADSSGRQSRMDEPDYSRFYKASFLAQPSSYKRGPSLNPSGSSPSPTPHYHRPANYFSYRNTPRDFMRPVRKGMLSTLASGEEYKNAKRHMDSIVPMGKEEAIRMSKFPDAHKPDIPRPLPIERDDWPAPPAPAAAYPELLRSHQLGRGRSEPTLDDDRTDGPADPRTQQNIEELQKIRTSGLGQVFAKDLAKRRSVSPPLDPRSASRTPAANREPSYKTRYESPLFASPSRDLDYARPRLHSMDDDLIGKKYRTSTLPISNFPVEPFRYESAKSLVTRCTPVPKPGYGLGSGSKSATLPTDSRNGSYFDDFEKERGQNGSADELSRKSYHTSQSSVEEYDPETGLRRSRWRASSATRSMSGVVSGRMSAPPYMSYRRSIPSLFKPDEPPKIYPYEYLLITNEHLPPDVDRNNAEFHLAKEDFEGIFRMTREDFYRLAEWKRNDLKRRVCLF